MRRRASAALAAAAVFAIGAAPSFAENRVALVIGNGAYNMPRGCPTRRTTPQTYRLRSSGRDLRPFSPPI